MKKYPLGMGLMMPMFKLDPKKKLEKAKKLSKNLKDPKFRKTAKINIIPNCGIFLTIVPINTPIDVVANKTKKVGSHLRKHHKVYSAGATGYGISDLFDND